jgi:hypothetical protein
MSFAAALVAIATTLAAFGPPSLLRPHVAALQAAESRATSGDWDAAQALLDDESKRATPEAAGLLVLHARMITRLKALDTSAPGLGRRYLRYVFAPDSAQLPAAITDLQQLATADDTLRALLKTPTTVTVEHAQPAVALLVRGALLDRARSHGLPLHASGSEDVIRIAIAQEEVHIAGDVLGGSGMRSFTTFFTLKHERKGKAPIDNGVIMQLLGINQARAIDTRLDRIVDRTLTGLVVEWIRRALLGDLAA